MAFLEQYRKMIASEADSIALGLKSGQIDYLAPAVRKLHELLRIVE